MFSAEGLAVVCIGSVIVKGLAVCTGSLVIKGLALRTIVASLLVLYTVLVLYRVEVLLELLLYIVSKQRYIASYFRYCYP